MRRYEIIYERVPIMTPIALIWDTCDTHRTFGFIIACFIIGVKIQRDE